MAGPSNALLKKTTQVNKEIGLIKKVPKKMSPEQVAKRKRSMISNAASKAMGGLYSK
jgi:hypothetical protein